MNDVVDAVYKNSHKAQALIGKARSAYDPIENWKDVRDALSDPMYQNVETLNSAINNALSHAQQLIILRSRIIADMIEAKP